MPSWYQDYSIYIANRPCLFFKYNLYYNIKFTWTVDKLTLNVTMTVFELNRWGQMNWNTSRHKCIKYLNVNAKKTQKLFVLERKLA